MIKKIAFSFLLVVVCNTCIAQVWGTLRDADSLKHEIANAKDDTTRVLMMVRISGIYANTVFDSAIFYGKRAQTLSQKISYPKGEVRSLSSLGSAFETNGDLPKSLELGFRGLEIAKQKHLPLETTMCLTLIGNVFWDLNDYPRAINFYRQAVTINETLKNQIGAKYYRLNTEVNIGTAFMYNKQLDSALAHLQKAYEETLDDKDWHPVFSMFLGDLKFRMGQRQEGLNYLHQSIEIFQNNKDHYSTSDACRIIAGFFQQLNQVDSSIYFAKKALEEAKSIGYKTTLLGASRILAEQYELKDIKEALYYRKYFDSINNDLYGANKVKNLQKTLSDEQDRQRKIEAERIAYQNRLKQYGLLAGLGIFLLIAFILYRNNKQKLKANKILEETLKNLKSTQSQLIQSEKMASLGELTAGIAHEIQNPLNFVNNFSEVSKELLDEMKTELDNGNADDAKEIANDVIQNLEKINHHGKRADAIVKNMLQHSKQTKGAKEPTDINALADEYLRLAYHGLRAKDKSLNAITKTDFDETIGKINIISQDIGRVLLNLYNNAFYAVNEKAKQQPNGYEPTISVTTKKEGDKVILAVKDNGNGIPQKIIDKIFQPFFTTKPTGEGTGLGLSLSYDIIKAHGGEIRVNTIEREGSEFIINLPA
ncbi:MAG: ATP-binding protein [Bacteroidota bacterium]|nr:ATP-binding protein [Bacteroidota bacterium]